MTCLASSVCGSQDEKITECSLEVVDFDSPPPHNEVQRAIVESVEPRFVGGL